MYKLIRTLFCLTDFFVLWYISWFCKNHTLQRDWMSIPACKIWLIICVYVTRTNKMSEWSSCDTTHATHTQCTNLLQQYPNVAVAASLLQLGRYSHVSDPGKSVTWLRLKIPGPLWMSCPATPNPSIPLSPSPTQEFCFSRAKYNIFKTRVFNPGNRLVYHASHSPSGSKLQKLKA